MLHLHVRLAAGKSQGYGARDQRCKLRQRFCCLQIPIVDHARDPVKVLPGKTVEQLVRIPHRYTRRGCLNGVRTTAGMQHVMWRCDEVAVRRCGLFQGGYRRDMWARGGMLAPGCYLRHRPRGAEIVARKQEAGIAAVVYC